MSGNSGSRFGDMQYSRRTGSSVSHGKNSSHASGTKVAPLEVRGGAKLSSRSLNSLQRSGTRPSASYGKYSGSSSRVDFTDLSSSASGSSTTALVLESPRASLSQGLQISSHCQSGSSDESGSELDFEFAEQFAKNTPLTKDTPSWRSLSASSSAGAFTSFPHSTMSGGGNLSRQFRNQDLGSLNRGENFRLYSSGSVRVPGTTSNSSPPENGILSQKQLSKPSAGSSLTSMCADIYSAPVNQERRARFNMERDDVSIGEAGASGQLMQASTSLGNAPRHFSAEGNASGPDSKGKSAVQTISSRRMRQLEMMQSARLRETNAPISLHGLVSSRRSLSTLDCSSLADVLPSASHSSPASTSERARQKRPMGAHGLTNGGDSSKTSRSGRNQMGSLSNLRTASTFESLAEQSRTRRVHPASRHSRQSLPPFPSEVRCPRRSVQLEADNVLHAASSFDLTDVQLHGRRRGSSPVGSRGRAGLGSLSISNEHLGDVGSTSGEELANRLAANTGNLPSSNVYRSQLVGTSTISNLHSNRNRSRSPTMSSPLVVQEAQLQSSFSGPPPSRPPPLPPVTASRQTGASFDNAFSLTAFSANPLSDSAALPVAVSFETEHERADLLVTESAAYGSSQSSHLHSIEENSHHLSVEGLSEILSALDRIERDEDLSYEHILMLEATILLGGIGLHDQHRDMRLDVDNMSYEELLALEERIGNVSTGLSEGAILKSLRRCLYACPNRGDGYTPEEVEVKCSICQEEFEEAVELGVLDCGHSYHIACIKHWLIQKNQCPICKAPAFT